jgi:hypothetical protein
MDICEHFARILDLAASIGRFSPHAAAPRRAGHLAAFTDAPQTPFGLF